MHGPLLRLPHRLAHPAAGGRSGRARRRGPRGRGRRLGPDGLRARHHRDPRTLAGPAARDGAGPSQGYAGFTAAGHALRRRAARAPPPGSRRGAQHAGRARGRGARAEARRRAAHPQRARHAARAVRDALRRARRRPAAARGASFGRGRRCRHHGDGGGEGHARGPGGRREPDRRGDELARRARLRAAAAAGVRSGRGGGPRDLSRRPARAVRRGGAHPRRRRAGRAGAAPAVERPRVRRRTGCARVACGRRSRPAASSVGAGPVAFTDIPAQLEAAHIGVVPTLSDAFTNLLLPVKLLEYVHMGLPVASSRLAGIERYFTGEELRYADPGSPASLADALAELCRPAGGRGPRCARRGADAHAALGRAAARVSGDGR